MDTIVRATCPQCQTGLRIPAQWIGQMVRCKTCGALMRSKHWGDAAAAANGTAESAPFDQTMPTPGAVPPMDGEPFPIPQPVAALPQPVPGYPYPAPPGYPSAPPGAYPYPVPPGYAPPAGYAPSPGYPYPVPPGYPYPTAPVAAHPMPLEHPGAVLAPHPPQPLPSELATPIVPGSSARRYRRKKGPGTWLWVGVCLLLTGALIGTGIWAMKHLAEQENPPEQAGNGGQPGGPPGAPTGGGPPVTQKSGPFPRRLLFISITKYMYLNPLTATKDGEDQSRPAARRIAYDWHIPSDKDNNQVFVLSDTEKTPAVPVKNVLTSTYERFLETSRDQDRIAIYFGGHAIEKGGKAYLAPMEGEIDGDEWQKTLIPLDDFYAKVKACKATEKVVIWDVCRFNPQRGKQRPGSDPMSPALHKALAAAPAGVEVVISCSPGENALEFDNLQPDSTNRSARYGGSLFLESVRYVGEKSRTAKAVMPADPLPIKEWSKAVADRAAAMATFTPDDRKQTVKAAGQPRADQVAYNPDEPVAKRFEMPVPPKGTSRDEIRSIEKEFYLPPIRPGLADTGLADLPFLDSIMKNYTSDVPEAEIRSNKQKYRLRAVTLDAFDAIREIWGTSPDAGGLGNLDETIDAPITEDVKKKINKGLEAYAVGIAKLELINIELDNVAGLKQGETKRWQAHYEYARAVVKARLAYLNEYNKLMGNVRTETLPELKPNLGQNSYKLASAERMKSGKEIQGLAEESQAAFARLIAEHKGTPWAIQAKRDRSFSLGLVWQPYVKKEATQ